MKKLRCESLETPWQFLPYNLINAMQFFALLQSYYSDLILSISGLRLYDIGMFVSKLLVIVFVMADCYFDASSNSIDLASFF